MVRFSGLAERLALRAGQKELVALVVVEPHPSWYGRGRFRYSRFSGRHENGRFLLREAIDFLLKKSRSIEAGCQRGNQFDQLASVSNSTFDGTLFLMLSVILVGSRQIYDLLSEDSSQCSALGELVSRESFWRAMR